MRFCRNCGKELPEGAKVCLGCGVREGDGTKFCPNCGVEPDSLAVICVKCGCELKPLHSKSPRKRRLWLWLTLIAAAVIGSILFFMRPSESDTTRYDNGHGYVDLGLPSGLKWATCNVGASSPEDYGDYYAWGELSTKEEYTESNCSTYKEHIGNISGNPQYDVARKKWGGSWRMPTRAEFKELIDNCTWEWTTKGGHNGYKVTGPSGNSIFLPAAGDRLGADTLTEDPAAGFRLVADTHSAESYGFYWSATPYEGGTEDAYRLLFRSDFGRVFWYDRSRGHSVRPVSE